MKTWDAYAEACLWVAAFVLTAMLAVLAAAWAVAGIMALIT